MLKTSIHTKWEIKGNADVRNSWKKAKDLPKQKKRKLAGFTKTKETEIGRIYQNKRNGNWQAVYRRYRDQPQNP